MNKTKHLPKVKLNHFTRDWLNRGKKCLSREHMNFCWCATEPAGRGSEGTPVPAAPCCQPGWEPRRDSCPFLCTALLPNPVVFDSSTTLKLRTTPLVSCVLQFTTQSCLRGCRRCCTARVPCLSRVWTAIWRVPLFSCHWERAETTQESTRALVTC